MITQTLDYSDGDIELEGYLAYQETDLQKPLVLVSHDWSGRRDFACKAAERVAAMGYVGLALDMYGKGVFGADGDTEKNAALMAPFAEDRSLLRQIGIGPRGTARQIGTGLRVELLSSLIMSRIRDPLHEFVILFTNS